MASLQTLKVVGRGEVSKLREHSNNNNKKITEVAASIFSPYRKRRPSLMGAAPLSATDCQPLCSPFQIIPPLNNHHQLRRASEVITPGVKEGLEYSRVEANPPWQPHQSISV